MKALLNVLLKTVPLFIIAYFWCEINPTEAYTWYDGIWQGIYVIPNWLLSFVFEGRLCKAVEYTTSYNIFWWICTVITSLYYLLVTFGIIMLLLGKNPNQAKQ